MKTSEQLVYALALQEIAERGAQLINAGSGFVLRRTNRETGGFIKALEDASLFGVPQGAVDELLFRVGLNRHRSTR